MKKIPLYLTGATAVGKSKLALRLCHYLRGEIISVDSMQVYRGLNIGTDKPDIRTREEIPHHLIDILDLKESFDAGRFAVLADQAVKDIQSRGKVPVFCGGTGMYFKAYLEGLIDTPAGSEQLREELEKMSLEELCARLKKEAPDSVQKIDMKNRRRVERALEIVLLTQKDCSRQRTQWNREAADIPFFFILQRPREELVKRIDQRVEKMFQRGLVEETKSLLKNGLEENRTAMQAIGYRQVVEYLHGQGSLEETKEKIKIRTRQFSKRQGTWFRGQFSYGRWIEAKEDVEQQAREIAEQYQNFQKDP